MYTRITLKYVLLRAYYYVLLDSIELPIIIAIIYLVSVDCGGQLATTVLLTVDLRSHYINLTLFILSTVFK